MDSISIVGYKKDQSGRLLDPMPLTFNDVPFYSGELVAGTNFEQLFNQTNSNIIPFLLNNPQVVKVDGKFILDKNTSIDDAYQVVSSHDSIKFNIDIKSPLKISAMDAGYVDTTKIDLKQDVKDQVKKSNNANLTIEIQNFIGLGLLAKTTFLDENYKPLFSVQNINNSADPYIFEVEPCQVDGNGVPTLPSIVKNTIVLTKEEIESFLDTKYIDFDIKLRSSGSTSDNFGPFVRVRAKDYVKIKIYGGVNYNVGPDD